MRNLTSRARKLVWFVAIVLLVMPVVLLGMPAGADEAESGGLLSDLRAKYDLGESELGQIDPTSATMNLLLLGLRGVAVNVLRMELDEYKNRKDWAQMQATTEAVITLQPHYIEVWRFLGWNLAYNVSAEWDSVPERFYWVKEGGKFLQRGVKRNDRVPELYFDTARIWGHKIGRSDEWRQFRGYFLSDPDTKRFHGNADQEINPQGNRDNYLVAKDWFHDANDVELKQDQHIMMRALFRSYPAKAQIEYADALQREGKFEGKTVSAWQQAYANWTVRYETNEPGFGKEVFLTSNNCKIFMEADVDDVRIEGGQVIAPGGAVSLAEIARVWYLKPQDLPPDVDPAGLEVTVGYKPERDTGTFSYAAHAAVVAVDPELGHVEILDYAVVEDGGVLVNPMVVDGQVYGGVAQGIGTALYEEMPYDGQGQPLASTLADYLLPGTVEVPDLRILHMETPSPYTRFGQKGIGESGAIGPPAAIGNAINDALKELGVEVDATPITPRRLLTLIQAAQS